MITTDSLKRLTFIIALLILSAAQVTAQVSYKSTGAFKYKVEHFPQFSIAPTGGAIFPLSRSFRDEFKPGGLAGLDMGLKLNKEVALFGHISYMFMSSKLTGAPVGQYMEFTAGPRYYFTHPKLKSQLYLEAGVGAYYFKQKSYVNPQDTIGTVIDQVSSTRPGLNGGIGASLHLTNTLDILASARYHNVFTTTGSVGFMTVNAGLELTIR